MRSSREHHLRSPDYWGRKDTIGEGSSTAWNELRLIPLCQQSQETHKRENPSGASTLLTISRLGMIGPIEAETLAEREARRQIKEQSRNIASGNTSEQGNAMCLE